MWHRLFVPKQSVGANLVYFDLFNAVGSDCSIQVVSVRPVVSTAEAVSITVGVDLHLTRTTAVGTGGTAATYNGTALDAATFSSIGGPSSTLHPNITARLTPSGGATAGAALSWGCVIGEETYAGAGMPPHDLVYVPDVPGIMVPKGTGIRVVQGSVAAAGKVGFNVVLKTFV